MTQLRDARLRQAMDEAPDAALRPPPRVRAAILQSAHAAVQPVWRRWWDAAGDRRRPWAAAFASVLVATLITLMWQGEEVPGPRPQGPDLASADRAPAPPAPPPPPQATPVPRAAPAEAAPAPRPQQEGRSDRKTEGRSEARSETTPSPRTGGASAAAGGVPSQDRERESERERSAAQARLGDTQRDGSARAPQEAPPGPAAAPAAAPAIESSPPLATAAAVPPVVPAPAPLSAQRAPAAAMRAAPVPLEWNQVRVEADGRSLALGRAQAGALPDLVARLLRSQREAPGPATPVALRIELAQDAHALGVLELVNERWRWTPLAQAQPAQGLRADEALVRAVKEEAARLLAR